MPRVGVGNMRKRVYDPDYDGIIALAQLVAAVCSETEADGKITTHKGDASAHHTKFACSVAASDSLQNSNDTEKSTTNEVATKIKEIKLDGAFKGSIRIKFELKGQYVTELVYGQVYRNGGAIGTLQSTASNSFQVRSEDFDPIDWAANDLIQIYAYKSAAEAEAFVQNFRFYYNIGVSVTNQDP